jgi:MATE family multidrug resistance protein
LLEVGAFGAAAFLAGRLNPIALAAHQIAINVASVTFMVPLGIASAAAITVGHALGRRRPALARHHGFIALWIAVVYEICTALCFLVFPRQILGLYTSDPGLMRTGMHLLQFAAAFQLFDGLQTVATGALRGLGNTKAAMLVNLCGYWLLGLPLGYWLCFRRRQGIYGVWFGLTLSLVVIAIVLCWEWSRRSRVPVDAATIWEPDAVKVEERVP